MIANSWNVRLAALIAIAAIGCGGDGRPRLVPVTGKVTLNGEPLAGAIVSFQPTDAGDGEFSRPSMGVTGPNGEFSLGTYDKTDGIPVGTYRVGIQKKELVGELPEGYNDETGGNVPIRYKWLTPRSVADPAESGLTAEVSSEGLEPAVFELSGEPEIEIVGGRRDDA